MSYCAQCHALKEELTPFQACADCTAPRRLVWHDKMLTVLGGLREGDVTAEHGTSRLEIKGLRAYSPEEASGTVEGAREVFRVYW